MSFNNGVLEKVMVLEYIWKQKYSLLFSKVLEGRVFDSISGYRLHKHMTIGGIRNIL